MSTFLIIYIFSILIHIVSLIITIIFIVPLQIKEAKVKNGLAKLRTQLLLFGVSVAILNSVSIIILNMRFLTTPNELSRLFGAILILVHALGFLTMAVVGYLIYHQQYTLEQKKLHKKIATAEKIDKSIKKG